MTERAFLITTDEFAYFARNFAAVEMILFDLQRLSTDGADRWEIERVPSLDGVTLPTAAQWAQEGEGAGCADCCALRMDGFDHTARPAFLRQGPSCQTCSGAQVGAFAGGRSALPGETTGGGDVEATAGSAGESPALPAEATGAGDVGEGEALGGESPRLPGETTGAGDVGEGAALGGESPRLPGENNA